jgi:hypothetical protein
LPDQLYSLTLFELNSLYYHRLRQDREGHYNAYLNVWMQGGKDKPLLMTPEEFSPLPGDPGWRPPNPKSEPTIQEHIDFMKRMGEGGPD